MQTMLQRIASRPDSVLSRIAGPHGPHSVYIRRDDICPSDPTYHGLQETTRHQRPSASKASRSAMGEQQAAFTVPSIRPLPVNREGRALTPSPIPKSATASVHRSGGRPGARGLRRRQIISTMREFFGSKATSRSVPILGLSGAARRSSAMLDVGWCIMAASKLIGGFDNRVHELCSKARRQDAQPPGASRFAWPARTTSLMMEFASGS